MPTMIVGLACLGIGMYAGKQRASGLDWCTVCLNLCKDTINTAKKVWNWATTPFRKGDPNIVDAEVIETSSKDGDES